MHRSHSSPGETAFWQEADELGRSVQWGFCFGCLLGPDGGWLRLLGDDLDEDDRHRFDSGLAPDGKRPGSAEKELTSLTVRAAEGFEFILPLGTGPKARRPGVIGELVTLRVITPAKASWLVAKAVAGVEETNRDMKLDQARIEAVLRCLEPLGVDVYWTDHLLTDCVYDAGLFFHAEGRCAGFLWYSNDQ